MSKCTAVCLGMFLGFAPAASSQAQAPACAARLQFAQKPKAKRDWRQTEFGMPYQVTVSAAVLATDANGRPCPGESVTLTALAVSVARTREKTDARGVARLSAAFDLPLGSLQVRVEACLTGDESLCARAAYPTLRDRVDLSLGFDLGGTFALTPSNSAGQHATDITGVGVLVPRLQINVFDKVRNFRPYRASIYGAVPFLAMGRGLYFRGGSAGPTFENLDQRLGLADYSVGTSLYLAGNALLDVSYNGRSGKVNLVDSIRNLGSPRLLNLGDGFESIDTSLQLRKRLGKTSWFGSLYGADSHAFRREFSSGGWAGRGEFYQVAGGIGRDLGKRGAGVLLWGGRNRYDEGRVQLGPKTSLLHHSRQDWLAGLTANGVARHHTNVGAGIVVGGLGKSQAYIALNLRLVFNLF